MGHLQKQNRERMGLGERKDGWDAQR